MLTKRTFLNSDKSKLYWMLYRMHPFVRVSRTETVEAVGGRWAKYNKSQF